MLHTTSKIEFTNRPDEKKVQEALDKMSRDGWRLVSSAGSQAQHVGSGWLMLFWAKD